jgi:hypothetical protein
MREIGKPLYFDEAELGDVIEGACSGAYSSSTIINIKVDDRYGRIITLFRPYCHTSDYKYTGGVIPYIGFEKYDVMYSSQPLGILLQKGRELR